MYTTFLQSLALWVSLQTVAEAFSPVAGPRQSQPQKHSFSESFRSSAVATLDLTTNDNNHIQLDLPDFTQLFDKIQKVSPLAKSVIQGNDHESVVTQEDNSLNWKTIESNAKGIVNQIQKLESFDGIATPLFRFRSQLEGPCIGEFFGRFIMDLNERRKWDSQIEQVHELHSIRLPQQHQQDNQGDCSSDMNKMAAVTPTVTATRLPQDEKYGKCARMGLGYGQTKKAFGITPREQMFLYGMQDFADGSAVIWGTELSEEYNHLLPQGPRHTRAKSHLFSATMKPRNDGAFDIEYVLQLDIGGSMPNWLTTPILIDTVKSLFHTAQREFAGATDSLQRFLQEKAREDAAFFRQHASLLIPH